MSALESGQPAASTGIRRGIWATIAILAPAILLIAMVATRQLAHTPAWISVPIAFTLIFWYPGLLLLYLIVPTWKHDVSIFATTFAVSFGLWAILAAVLQLVGGSLSQLESLITTSILVLAILTVISVWRSGVSNRQIGWRMHFLRRSWESWVGDLFFWLAVVLVLGIFIYFASVWRPSDRWGYAGILRAFIDRSTLSIPDVPPWINGYSRQELSPWLAILAVLGLVSGADLTVLYSIVTPAILLFLALCAAFALGRQVLTSKWAAGVAVLLLPLYWLTDIALPETQILNWQERFLERLDGGQSTLGLWVLIGRIVEDKFLLLFVLLPITQALIIRYYLHGGGRKLALLALVAAGAILVHPLGVVFIVLSMAALVVPNLVMRFSPARFRRATGLAVAMAVAGLIPFLQRVRLVGNTPDAIMWTLKDQAFIDEASRFGLWVSQTSSKIYAAHPYLILRRELLVVALAGVILLVAVRGLHRPKQQFLLGAIGVSLLVTFNPLVAPWLGRIITWLMVFRTYWLIILPCLLVLAALLQMLVVGLRAHGSSRQIPRLAALVTPLLFAALLLFLSAPKINAGLELLADVKANSVQPDEFAVLQFLRNHGDIDAVVLAEPGITNELPAEVGHMYGLYFRPEGYTVKAFADADAVYREDRIDAGRLVTLDDYVVNYVIAQTGTGLERQLSEYAPTVEPIFSAGRYTVFRLADGWQRDPLLSALLEGARALTAGDLVTANDSATRAQKLAPEGLSTRQLLAAILARQGDFPSALALIQPIFDREPTAPFAKRLMSNVYRAQGVAVERQGDPVSATELYRKAFASDPTDLVSGEALIRLHRAANGQLLSPAETDAIVDAFIHTTEPAPDRLSYQRRLAYTKLADIYTLLDRPDAAEIAYRSALALTRPQDSEAVATVALGKFLIRQGRTDEARQLYLDAQSRNPSDEALHLALAELEERLGVPNAKEIIMTGAARTNPWAAWPHFELGRSVLRAALQATP